MRSALYRGTAVLLLAAATSCTSTDPSPGITLTLGGQTLQVTQGATNNVTIDVARVNFDGEVALSASGLPTGVTASFAPATMTGSASSSTLTLTAAVAALSGDATVTISASGVGIETRTATLALTVNVAGNFTIGATPATVNVTRGSTASTTIFVARNAGFGQDVTLSASGLPTGVTASFNPATLTTTAGSSILTLTATNSAALGAATVTITAASTGIASQTTNLSLTVQDVGSTTQLTLDFCSDEIPTWMAHQNEGAAWTRIMPDANGTVTLNATAKLAVALVFSEVGFTDVEVIHTTVAELAPINGVTCVEETGGKTLTGSVANLGAGNTAEIDMGSSSAFVDAPSTSYSLFNVPNGAVDLVASRFSAADFDKMPDKVIVRRALNIANNGTIAALDWNASEAVASATSALTVTGAGSDDVFGFNEFITNASGSAVMTTHETWFGDVISGSASFTSIPFASTVTGDIHALGVFAIPTTGQNFRGATTFFRTAANKTIALGAHLTAPTVTNAATSPYLRHRVQQTAGEYSGAFLVELLQTFNATIMYVSHGYLGAAPTTWDVTMPDFSGVSGWDNSWALTSGAATDVFVQAITPGPSIILQLPGAEGTTTKFAAFDLSSSTSQLSRVEAAKSGRSRGVQKSALSAGSKQPRREQ